MLFKNEIIAVLASRLGARQFRTLFDSICQGELPPTPEAALSASQELADLAADPAVTNPLERTITAHLECSGQIISIFEKRYPESLRHIEYPPPVLFARGTIECLENPHLVGVVGSRAADPQSWQFTRTLSSELARLGSCIVSGMAIGIDSAAHRGALDSGQRSRTIAVLGSGFAHIHPKSNLDLYQLILDRGGLVLSQFEPEQAPFPANFLNRNRVISGLSRALLVVQASLRSGSLVTARNALEQGRELMVVPGSVFDTRYQGSNKLIKSGAHLVTSVDDVLEILDIKAAALAGVEQSANQQQLSPTQREILELLRERGRLHAVELQSSIGAGNLNEELLSLELEGRICGIPGDFWTIRADLQ